MDIASYLAAVEAQMHAMIQTPISALAPFYGMMAYHLGWVDRDFRLAQVDGGKRFRPLLCLLACEAQGGDWRRALPAAAALELMHNFSLIHDDIEDSSPTRRHRETVWYIWGISQAVNVGDGMLMMARLALDGLEEQGFPAEKVLAASRLLDSTCLRLCQGQYLDLTFEEQPEIDMDEYLFMISSKTAALIAAAAEMGALLASDAACYSADMLAAWHEFGWELGLAFQMVDDILGIWGDVQVTGKPATTDILSRKKSLPIVYALARLDAASESGKLLRYIYSSTSKRALSEEDVAQVLALLEEVGAKAYVKREALSHTERALAILDRLGLDNPAAKQLREIAISFGKRAY